MRGVPKKTQDLQDHTLVAFGEDPNAPFAEVNWLLDMVRTKQKEPTLFKINSLIGMLKAVESGVGVAGLPDYMVRGLPHISKILPEVKGPATDVYYVYSMEMRNSKRVNVFKDFLIRKLAEDGLGKAA
jgi:DNA-binding transcriptional LysR family regulator